MARVQLETPIDDPPRIVNGMVYKLCGIRSHVRANMFCGCLLCAHYVGKYGKHSAVCEACLDNEDVHKLSRCGDVYWTRA